VDTVGELQSVLVELQQNRDSVSLLPLLPDVIELVLVLDLLCLFVRLPGIDY
jgi:hypothetical protein